MTFSVWVNKDWGLGLFYQSIPKLGWTSRQVWLVIGPIHLAVCWEGAVGG